MAPLIDISSNDFERAKQLLTLSKVKYTLPNKEHDNSDFIYIPSIKLYVAKERTLLGKDFHECQELLHNNNERMPTPFEFIEFLKYTKENNSDIYNEITQVRSPWRAEWLDADFKTKGKDLYVNYHVFDSSGKIIQKSKLLDKNTLMKDKTPGISLDYLLNNPTSQGFPSKNAQSGDLYYWYPRSDNDSVARFIANSDRAILDAAGFRLTGIPISGYVPLGTSKVWFAGYSKRTLDFAKRRENF